MDAIEISIQWLKNRTKLSRQEKALYPLSTGHDSVGDSANTEFMCQPWYSARF